MPTKVDETTIRNDVESRSHSIQVHEDWITPSGNTRKAPMFEASIGNDFLGLSRVVKGRTRGEVRQKAEQQISAWAQREIRARISEAKEGLRGRATEETQQAQEELEDVRSILRASLSVDDRLDWETLLEKGEYEIQPYPKPIPEHSDSELPPKKLRHFLLRRLERRRQATIAELRKAWADVRSLWQEQHAKHEAQEQANRQRFDAAKLRKNESIRAFRADFEAGQPRAIEEYIGMVFERSVYPKRFPSEREVHFDEESHTAIVDISFRAPQDLSDVIEYRPTERNTRLREVQMKKKDHAELYDAAVKQSVLRTAHEVFESVYTPHVEYCVVNGWTTVTNPGTGHDETSCIVSVSTDRDTFEGFNLAAVDPTECLKRLKGLIAGPLSQIAPVKPIMEFKRDDSRFIASRDVLDSYDSRTNLAEISWEEFEHLVRELFAKMFSGEGIDVRVTQASRDAGVDAIVFDPDPIRGGKFVIQAKRYTNVVGVSAVRDLFGTMMNEGAVKGILVTTSHYGPDSREFAKDKPLTLIDGSNLVHLLEQHGHQVRIDVKEARRRAQDGPKDSQ